MRLIFFVVVVVLTIFTLGFTLLFTLVGAALRHGQTAEGEITFVGYDETPTFNCKNP